MCCRVVEDRDLVTVLETALVYDRLHLLRNFGRKAEGLKIEFVVFGAHGHLRSGRVDKGALELGQLCRRVMRGRDRLHDDSRSRINHGRRNLSGGKPARGANREGCDRKPYDNALERQLHSISSVAIRSDFKKRTSCGVMVSRAAGFLSGSDSCSDS